MHGHRGEVNAGCAASFNTREGIRPGESGRAGGVDAFAKTGVGGYKSGRDAAAIKRGVTRELNATVVFYDIG